MAAKQAKIAAAAAAANFSSSSSGTNLGGIGVYNADVENYLLQFLLVEKRDKPTSALIHEISMPPETMEFDRVGSLRRGQLNSADSSDSIDSGVGVDATTSTDATHQPQIRGRAATFDVYKIRTRVGSKVAQITKISPEVLASKPTQKRSGTTSVKRFLSTKKKSPSSPQVFQSQRKSYSFAEIGQIFGGSNSSNGATPPSPRSVLLENGGVKSALKESEREGEDVVDSGMKASKMPRSAESSPQMATKFAHASKILAQQRAKSSDNIADLSGIELADIEMTEKQSVSSESSVRPMSPIDWEAVGDNRTEEKVYNLNNITMHAIKIKLQF